MKPKILLLFLFSSFFHSLSGQKTDSQIKRMGSQFVYEDCGCEADVKLTIFDGLNELGNEGMWGGKEVKKNSFGIGRDKFNDGAITIANLNDTDGDGNIDIYDPVVSAGVNGIDEVDLMKLIITPSGKVVGDCKITLTYEGSIKFYSTFNKGTDTEVTDLTFPIVDGTDNNIISTLFIEATDISSNIRDIKVFAHIGNEIKDKVSATAIWVDKQNIYSNHTNKINSPTTTSLSGLNQQGLIDQIEIYSRAKDGTRYGFGSFGKNSFPPFTVDEDIFNGGRVLFEYVLFPNSIMSEISKFNISLDGARRQSNQDYCYDNNNYYPVPCYSGPPPPPLSPLKDKANDDPQSNGSSDYIDEDKIPMTLYTFDSPSSTRSTYLDYGGNPIGISQFTFRDVEFEEFIRVSFKNGSSLIGNTLAGS